MTSSILRKTALLLLLLLAAILLYVFFAQERPLSPLTGQVSPPQTVGGKTYIPAALGFGETMVIPAGAYGIVTCDGGNPFPTNFTSYSPYTYFTAIPGFKTYEFSRSIPPTEKNMSLSVSSRWSGARYGYNTSNTLSGFYPGRTYLVSADVPFQFACTYNTASSSSAGGTVSYLARWPLEEAVTTTTTTGYGGGNGTVTGGAQREAGAFLASNRAFTFDGVDDAVTVSTTALQFDFTTPFSITLWVRSARAQDAILLSKRFSSSGNGYELKVRSDGTLQLILAESQTKDVRYTSSAVLPVDGKFHYVVVTYDPRLAEAGRAKIYMDQMNPLAVPPTGGVTTFAVTNPAPGTFVSAANLRMGAGIGASFAGALDEINIYNKVITADVNCFVAGTPILMADGSKKAIEQVRVGDRVRSMDPVAGSVTNGSVTAVRERMSEERVLLFTETRKIEVTEEHPFWVDGAWKTAGTLRIGDALTLSDGTQERVIKTDVVHTKAPVFNMTVDGTHTYFANDLLVHNKNILVCNFNNICELGENCTCSSDCGCAAGKYCVLSSGVTSCSTTPPASSSSIGTTCYCNRTAATCGSVCN